MITNKNSWSLGLCSNKSFEPDLRSETPVRPLHPGDHPLSSAQSNCVHSPTTSSASLFRSLVVVFANRENREISLSKFLISRVCTTLHVNQIFFCTSPSSQFAPFPPVQIQTTSAPLKPAKNQLYHIKPDKNHLAFFTSPSEKTTNHINHLFRKKTGIHNQHCQCSLLRLAILATVHEFQE